MKPCSHSRASSFTLKWKRMKRCLSPELLVQTTISQLLGPTEVLAQEHTEVRNQENRTDLSFKFLQNIYLNIEEQLCATWWLKINLSFPSELYTLEGNAFGKPCAFPFFYKDRWFGDCTMYDSSVKRAWCAVGTRFENDQWGYCPTSCEWEHATQCVKLCLCDERVGHLYFCLLCLWAATDKWIKNIATGAYYQLNVQSVLTWFQAEKSCKQQGASLLSVSDPHQQAFVSGRNPPGHILAEKLFCPTEHI